MDKAYRLDTQEIIWAEELPALMKERKRDELTFQCSDSKCRIKVIANSYKLTNKKVPYFSINPKLEHAKDCEEALINGLIGRAKNYRLTTKELKVVGYPSQLFIPDIQEQVIDLVISTSSGSNQSTTTSPNRAGYNEEVSFDPEDVKNNNKVSSIKRIVDFYLGFERNRDVKIEVLGIVNEYRFLFRRIGYGKNHSPYIDNKIFYAPLKLFKEGAMMEDNDKMVFDLLPYKENSANNYKVVLSKKGMTTQKISRIRNNYKRVFEATYERFVLNMLDKDYGGYVFFFRN